MAVYQSEFQGATIDARLAAVATMQTAISNLESAVAAKYSKPSSGIPETDLDADVNAALAKANSAIQSLADYYTKTEVDALFAAVNSLDYVDVASLPTASASTLGKIYLVGPDGSGYYSYYYTSYDGTNYSWVGPLGTTEISLSNYATKAELNQLDQKVDKLAGETGIAVGYSLVANEYVSASNGSFLAYSGWSRTDYIDISAYSSIKIEGTATGYNYFYAADKSPVSNLNLALTGSTLDLSNYPTAKYIVLSDSSANMANLSITVLGYRGDTIVSLGTRVSALEANSDKFGSLPQDGLAFVKHIVSSGETGYVVVPLESPIALPKGMPLTMRISGVTINSGSIAAYFRDSNGTYYSANSAGEDAERTVVFDEDKTIVEYGINKSAPSVVFSSDVYLMAGYIAQLDEIAEDVETIKGEVSANYTTIVATRNLNDYNSIREIVAGITDATPSHKYIVYVPAGRWFECDLRGKPNVIIVGEDREKTVLYCDGTSSNLTPSDYSYGADYSNKALNTLDRIYKHVFFATADLNVKNLTVECNDCKYCLHGDNVHFSSIVFDNCHFIAGTHVSYPIGLGIIGGQKVRITNSIIENTTPDSFGVFSHNWNNQDSPCSLVLDKCYFKNCGFILADELGSEQEDLWMLTDCYSDAGGQVRFMVDSNGDGDTYWQNGGVNEPNPQNVPYCIKICALGSNVGGVVSKKFGGSGSYAGSISRPDAIKTISASNIAVIPVGTHSVGDVIIGYPSGTRLNEASNGVPLGVVQFVDSDYAYIIVIGCVMVSGSDITGATSAGTKLYASSGRLTTTENTSLVGIVAGTYEDANIVYLLK